MHALLRHLQVTRQTPQGHHGPQDARLGQIGRLAREIPLAPTTSAHPCEAGAVPQRPASRAD